MNRYDEDIESKSSLLTSAPHRGFGFIEFEHPEDAKAAQDNMHLSELFGKTIKVNLARPLKGAGPGGRGPERAIWADEEWIKKHTLGEEAPSTADPEQGIDPRPEPSTA
ncbi:hypothetical protein DFQ26_000582 [Actinomortierella ambigua]|nr:hypothetical protein DFQ26_000582 [Actinomortierella ambigua]